MEAMEHMGLWKNTKIKLYKTLVRSEILYEGETYVENDQERGKKLLGRCIPIQMREKNSNDPIVFANIQ